jgi:arylsulfatase A-like enzyme
MVVAGHLLPHVLLMLADDYDWSNAGWHRPGFAEVRTPHLDALVESGINLERHYAFKYCSPSRSALQSGRDPIHVNVFNYLPIMHNPADPVSGFSAIPRNMTGIAELMRKAGYSTAMAGKWDAGQATFEHTPKGRGYDRSLFYFNHDNDCTPTRDPNAVGLLTRRVRPMLPQTGPASAALHAPAPRSATLGTRTPSLPTAAPRTPSLRETATSPPVTTSLRHGTDARWPRPSRCARPMRRAAASPSTRTSSARRRAHA